ncbi:HAD family hydrolase [Vibrio sp. CAU 1672]|uniref:HAD family hydrolase n=1 Tax=Vibrio sp. CAU 1672 TaxID=3032594 RepID=UPI0023DC49D6|nr:HAD family hydrolase [Vibrio sp. CAU 1672]MDF2155845.1 HAD-IB family hydrolase [Vibrio sp. CAU 1672]
MIDTNKPSLALFDFDGTITDADMFSLFLNYSASGPRKWLGKVLILPFYTLYKAGVIPARRMRPIASFIAFAGRETRQVKALGEQFAREVICCHIRPEAQNKLNWHQQKADTIVVVSASLNAYLKPWCEAQGYQLLCSEILSDKTRISGIYQTGDCSLKRKVARLKNAFDVNDYGAVYAYGDTYEDLPMLRMANHAMLNWKVWQENNN